MARLTGKGSGFAPDRSIPFLRVFFGHPKRSESTQPRQNPSQTVKIPIFFSSLTLFWFVFWFHGDFTHVPDDVTKPDNLRGKPQSHQFHSLFSVETPIFEVVRAARVELTTFGSGGRRSIQLSYARNGDTLPGQRLLLKSI